MNGMPQSWVDHDRTAMSVQYAAWNDIDTLGDEITC
jgi:hypothetical protein